MARTRRRESVELFVSPQGDDRWSGRLSAPAADAKDGPFASLSVAASAARRLRKIGAVVTVRLRGGRHELADTWRLGAADGGSLEHPALWAAYPGERPVLSGGRRITGWRAGNANGKDCWITDLPEVADGSWWFTQLWVDGRRAPRASLPKQGWWHFAALPDGAIWKNRWFEGPQHLHYAEGTLDPTWRNLDDVELIAPELWYENHLRIAAIEPATRTVRLRAPMIGRGIDENGKPDRFQAVHVFEALGEPGEWYLDRQLGRLFYLPRPGETIDVSEFIAPRVDTLIEVAGSATRPVQHLHLIGLDLRHAEVELPADHPGAVQAAVHMPGALRFLHARHCVVRESTVSRVGQYAVEIGYGCHQCVVADNHLHDLGAGGVKIEHEWLIPDGVQGGCTPDHCATWHARQVLPEYARLPLKSKAPKTSLRQCATVEDNRIHDGCLVYRSAIGIWIGNCGGNRIRRNHLHDLGYTGISCGWTWGYADSATIDNRIEHNHIHHINWQPVLSDNGAIYCLGRHPLGTIRGNHIHHVGCWGYGGWGLYLDEGSSHFLVEGNLVHHTKHAGFNTHFGRDNTVRGNCFAYAQREHIAHGRPEAHRSTRFEGNLLVWDAPNQPILADWSGRTISARDNLLWAGGREIRLGGRTVGEWQAMGQLKGCLVADPCFAAPEDGDFRLRAGSPASAMGLRVPLDAGPQGWRARAETRVHTRIEIHDSSRATLHVENLGETVVNGKVRVLGSHGVTVLKGAALAVRGLAPGKALRQELHLAVTTQRLYWSLETAVHGAGFLSTLETHYPTLHLPRLAVKDPAGLGAALDAVGATAWAIPGPDCQDAGQVRLAHTGSHLAVEIVARDGAPSQGEHAWEGSCVEIFGSAAAAPERRLSPNGLGHVVGQVFLVPAVGASPVRGAKQVGSEKTAPEILLDSTTAPGGWRLNALVPLALLHVADRQKRFCMELVLTVRPSGDRPTWRGQLGCAYSAFQLNLDYTPVVLG